MKKFFCVLVAALCVFLSVSVAFATTYTCYVRYVYEDGSTAAPDMYGNPHVGVETLIPIPRRTGFVPSLTSFSLGVLSDYPVRIFPDGSGNISFFMPSGSLEMTVTYIKGEPPPSSSDPPPPSSSDPPPSSSDPPPPSSSDPPPSSSDPPPSSSTGISINPDYVGFNQESIYEMAATLRFNIGSGFTAFLIVFLFVSTIYLLINISKYLFS